MVYVIDPPPPYQWKLQRSRPFTSSGKGTSVRGLRFQTKLSSITSFSVLGSPERAYGVSRRGTVVDLQSPSVSEEFDTVSKSFVVCFSSEVWVGCGGRRRGVGTGSYGTPVRRRGWLEG